MKKRILTLSIISFLALTVFIGSNLPYAHADFGQYAYCRCVEGPQNCNYMYCEDDWFPTDGQCSGADVSCYSGALRIYQECGNEKYCPPT